MSIVRVFDFKDLEPLISVLRNATASGNTISPLSLFTYSLATFYILLFLSGMIGNTWAISIIVSLFRHRTQEPPRNVQLYILVLCLIDIFVLGFMPFTIDNLLNDQWTLIKSSLLCKLSLCSDLFNKFFAPIILMALSGTCYMCVCRRQCRDFPNDLRAGFAIIILAVGVLIILMAPVFVYGDLYYIVVYGPAASPNETSVIKYLALKCLYQPIEEKYTVHDRMSDYILYAFVIGYVLPASSFTIFYILVWRFVRRHSWRARSLVDSWRVARTVLGLISFFLFCWTPYWMMVLYSNKTPQYKPADRHPITLAFTYATHLLPYLCCLGYPLIYIMLNRKIKENYELIRAKRRSQILALCGFGKNEANRRETKKESQQNHQHKSNDQQHINLTPPSDQTQETTDINDVDGVIVLCPRSSLSSRTSRSNDALGENGSASGSSADNQSLFANVNELMELSRHLLIPLIQINDKEEKEHVEMGLVYESQPDVIL